MVSTSRDQEIIEIIQKKQLMLGNKAVVQGLLTKLYRQIVLQ